MIVNDRRWFVLCGTLVAMLNFTNAAFSQDKARAKPKSRRATNVNNQASAGLVRATSVLNVVPQPGATGDVLERQLNVAGQIREAAQRSNYLPEGRIQHFAWLDASNSPPVIGWTGVIEDMTETPQGTRVRLQVSPKFAGQFHAGSYTTETFLVKNTTIQAVSLVTSDPSLPRVVTSP